MANGFVKNVSRKDPYKNYKFRVILDGKTVMGVSKVGALKRTTEVIKHRNGNDPSHDSKSPGRTTYESITMERGITHDPDFEIWANRIHSFGGDTMMDLAGFKRELMLEMMNEKGHVVHRYFLHNTWVSEYTAMPDLDANANAVAIESLKLEIEGFEHDPNTKEPDEKSDVPQSP
jgi:phage tail-like protein